tara:strand:- start:4569 stop:4862 length:294 start_codon:yes stop_codon:yes gene_type:complete
MAYKRKKFNHRHGGNNRKNKSGNRPAPIAKSKRPSHVSVYNREGEPPERLVSRFLKKCKKIKIIEQYRETLYFVKPSEKKRTAKRKAISRAKKQVAT